LSLLFGFRFRFFFFDHFFIRFRGGSWLLNFLLWLLLFVRIGFSLLLNGSFGSLLF